MKGQKKKQNGITLIALVISIIVMLILAGVSINALMGDNGILRQAQFASFMSEMAAVEEAVQLWGAEHYDDENHSIPASGILPESEVNNSERLGGEIGYYRTWSRTSVMPATSVTVDSNTFNNTYRVELVSYPGGIEDLYYLDNDGLNLNSNKKYIIDAVNSMIYSVQGISLNGVRCYSLAMAKAVMNGTYDAPAFASAEVSGAQANGGIKAAGNNEPQYIEDEDGNLVENPNYNPNGFQIIADPSNNNIYKLYNNGDLYGKGIKGNLLNTSESDMEVINAYIWNQIAIPSNIPGYNDYSKIKIYNGNGTLFIIDSENHLWAKGSNENNYLGLDQEQQNEYTGREFVKLDIAGKQISRIIPTRMNLWVITVDNLLYACGYNLHGQLGIGQKSNLSNGFYKVNGISDPSNIKMIKNELGQTDNDYMTFILMNDGTLYCAGDTSVYMTTIFSNTQYASTEITSFVPIFNGTYGTAFSSKITYISAYAKHWNRYTIMLHENGTLTHMSSNGSTSVVDTNVVEAYGTSGGLLYKKVVNGVVSYMINPDSYGTWSTALGLNSSNYELIDITDIIEENINISEITKCAFIGGNIFFLTEKDNKKDIYFAGSYSNSGMNISSGYTDKFVKITDSSNTYLPNVEDLIFDNTYGTAVSSGTFLIKGSDGNLYSTANSSIMYGDDLLQKSWIKINPENVKVKHFNARTSGNNLAFIDTNNDIWVLGNDVRTLGINHSEDDIDIHNFVLLKDYLSGLPIYNNINGHVIDYKFGYGGLFILTDDDDNNTLYSTGEALRSGWPYTNDTGFTEDKFIPTKLLENVKCFDGVGCENFMAICIDENDKEVLYGWGIGNCSDCIVGSSKVPKKYSEYSNKVDTIVNSNTYTIFQPGGSAYIKLGNGDVYAQGLCRVPDCSFGLTTSGAPLRIIDQSYFNNENIIQIVKGGGNSTYFLSDSGNLYGCGAKNLLGLNTIDTTQQMTPSQLLKSSDISQIAGGPGWCILVKNDGSVYGTGSNYYGVLGRWVGVNRNSTNSRYRTAFEWVECPELEI